MSYEKIICKQCKEKEIEYIPEICYACIDKMLPGLEVKIEKKTKPKPWAFLKDFSIYIILYLLFVIPIYVFFGKNYEVIAVMGFCYGLILPNLHSFIIKVF